MSGSTSGRRSTTATWRIRRTLAPAGLDWISALKTADLRKLLKPLNGGRPAPLRPEELQPDAVAEILSPDFPGERLVVCLNPRLAEERARKREDLLKATEAILERIAGIVRRKGSRLRGLEKINRRVGREANRRKVEKHFDIAVTHEDLTFKRNTEKIAAEARLTASTSCAPASMPRTSMRTGRWPPTNRCPAWSVPSGI